MKNICKLLFFVFFAAFATPAFAQMTNSGYLDMTSSSTFMDILNTEAGVIKGTRSLFGHKLTNKGTCHLDRCIMKKEVVSQGVLNANATKFEGDFNMCSGKTTLTSCCLADIYILDSNDEESANPIHLVLDGATTVNGSIIFETGLGKVFKCADVIINGDILGGTLIDSEN